MSTTKINVTYRNLILLGLALAGVIFFAQQILSGLNIAFFHFKIAGFDFMPVVGFVMSLYGTWSAFEATKKTESKEQETSNFRYLETQYQMVMREIDENKEEIKKVEEHLVSQSQIRGKRLGESEQKIYAISLQLESYQEMFKRFIILEDRANETKSRVDVLSALFNKELPR